MKTIYKTLLKAMLLIAFSFSICGTSFSQDKIRLELRISDPNHFKASQLCDITITNNDSATYEVNLEGAITHSKDGKVVSGRSGRFALKPGTTVLNSSTMQGCTHQILNDKYKGIESGNPPEGQYSLCVELEFSKGQSLAKDCREITIEGKKEITGELHLISPVDEAQLEDGDTVPPKIFIWTPLPNAESYTLKIVPIQGTQSAEAAMKNNPAFILKEGIRTTTYEYRLSDSKLEDGQKYAWMVSSGEVKSEVYTINIMKKDTSALMPPSMPPMPLSPCDCNLYSQPYIINVCLGQPFPIVPLGFQGDCGPIFIYWDPPTIPTTPGDYPYTYWVLGQDLEECIYQITLHVKPVPDIPIVSGPTTLPCNSFINLTTPFVSGYTYQWYKCPSTPIGSGSIIAGIVYSPNIFVPGCYKVKVTNDELCSTTSAPCWCVTDPTPVPIITGPHEICLNNLPVKTLTTNGIGTLQWFLNGVSILAATTSTINIIGPGTYTVTSTVGGCVTTSANWVVTAYPCGCNTCNFTISVLTVVRDPVNLQKYKVTVKIKNLSDCPGYIKLIMLSSWGGGTLTSPIPLPKFTIPNPFNLVFYFTSSILNPNQVRVDFQYTELNGFSCKKTIWVTIPI